MKHIQHFFAAFGYSLEGLVAAFKGEMAFQQESLVLLAVIALALILFPVSLALSLIGAWLFVMALELLNMGIESLADLVTTERHPLVKKAKDAGSAAVFLALVANGIFWLAALWQTYGA